MEPVLASFIRDFQQAVKDQTKSLEVVGTDSSSVVGLFLTQMMGSPWMDQAQVVIVPSEKEVVQLEAHIHFFDSSVHVSVLPSFDVSPFSGLYPSAKLMSGRLKWLYEAQKPQPNHVFIASSEAIAQRTMSPKFLQEHTWILNKDEEIPDRLTALLDRLGFVPAPMVEDVGTYALRGGIIDIFSPAHALPARIELFGDSVQTIRFFNEETQRSEQSTESFTIIPTREILFDDENRMRAAQRFRANTSNRDVDPDEKESILQSLVHGLPFPGLDFLIGDFFETFSSPLEHFVGSEFYLWMLNPIEIERENDLLLANLKSERQGALEHVLLPEVSDLYLSFRDLPIKHSSRKIEVSKIAVDDQPDTKNHSRPRIELSSVDVAPRVPPSSHISPSLAGTAQDSLADWIDRILDWRRRDHIVFVATSSKSQCQRLAALLERSEIEARTAEPIDRSSWSQCIEEQWETERLIHLIPRKLYESVRIVDEKIVFLRDEDFFGKRRGRKPQSKTSPTAWVDRSQVFGFADLHIGDLIVHAQHGIGVYEGLKVISIGDVQSEFVRLEYKDGDKLYLPIYRINQIQKYSGASPTRILDKLGGTQWPKVKSRVRHRVREIAADLIQLYAKRSQVVRPPFPDVDDEFVKFEAAFLYDETEDQLKAVSDILSDMRSERPMDRLVCGDVGFGKTEVAMRSAFKAIEGNRQVAVLAPTTVLSFQHFETFQNRFKKWPVTIRTLNRFVPKQEVKKTLEEMRNGQANIVIGTHRLLGKDIKFKELGLLIIDEEQRFGVTHKEKIRKMKTVVDTLTLSATPIPRTLNMSLVGMRDLSLINTPPVDRLPTRTFVCKFSRETIQKAVSSEIQRGGQVFFLHNRVQSIYSLSDELKELLPGVRIKVAHGQLPEDELEKTMVAFFKHEIDVLVCTTIIESGIDNPRANTMFIDNAHTFGLSQLYQLRGRVGRSKERAYCYLLIPANKRIDKDAQERLKIIQDNTALGSGIKIAHHDLELRGVGNLLGEEQSGQIEAVGYEMYLELLEEAIRTLRGEDVIETLEPEINLRVSALIPDVYIPDIRIRMSYYKALTKITSPDDVDQLEEELTDQFGRPPEPVFNLMGVMLIRYHCQELGIRDLSAGPKSVSLALTEQTPLSPETLIKIASDPSKKYSLTPDMRLVVRINPISWPNVYEELLFLQRQCPTPSLDQFKGSKPEEKSVRQ